MILLGSIVNVLLVVIGGILGVIAKKGISSRFADLIMNGIGLITTVIGITYATKTQNILIVVISIVLGALIGEGIDIDKKLNSLGEWVKIKLKGEEDSRIGEGIVTATLLFCVGSMAIMGSLDSGLRNDHTILYTKAIMDGIAAMLFASSMGVGVILSAVPLFIYQGTITLLSSFLQPYLAPELIIEMSAVGGVLLIGLGFSILHIKTMKVANLLPAIFIPIVLMQFFA